MTGNIEFRPSSALLVVWWVRNWVLGLLISALLGLAISADGNTVAGLIAAAIGVGLVFAISFCMTVHFYTIRYLIDSTHVVRSAGFLWKVKRATPLDKITNIDVRQGPLERLLAFGQVWIFTPSTGQLTPEVKLTGVATPHEIKDEIIARTGQATAEGTMPSPGTAAGGGAVAGSVETVNLLREMAETLKRIEKRLEPRDQ